jgi:hypothetical protein
MLAVSKPEFVCREKKMSSEKEQSMALSLRKPDRIKKRNFDI